MPLHEGKEKRTISKNISEMMHSKTFGEGKSKEKRQQMAIAAAMHKAGKNRHTSDGYMRRTK